MAPERGVDVSLKRPSFQIWRSGRRSIFTNWRITEPSSIFTPALGSNLARSLNGCANKERRCSLLLNIFWDYRPIHNVTVRYNQSVCERLIPHDFWRATRFWVENPEFITSSSDGC